MVELTRMTTALLALDQATIDSGGERLRNLMVLSGMADGIKTSGTETIPDMEPLLARVEREFPTLAARLGLVEAHRNGVPLAGALLKAADSVSSMSGIPSLIQPEISVFGGNVKEGRDELLTQISLLAAEFRTREFSVIYGGGTYGLPAAFAEQVKGSIGTFVLGITTPLYAHESRVHECERIEVPDLSARKDLLAKSDGFLLLPGGSGSLDEFAHVFELLKSQKDNRKRVVIFNPKNQDGEGYFDHLGNLLKVMVSRGALQGVELARLIITDSPLCAVDFLLPRCEGLL